MAKFVVTLLYQINQYGLRNVSFKTTFSMLFSLFLQILPATPDGGVLYAETDFNHLIVEPWNAYSSLTFLLPVLYWAIRLRGEYRENMFLLFCMPLLALGGIGSTVYHAFRSSPYFLMMDVFPIMLLTLMVGLYFWWRIVPHWIYVVVIAVASMTLRFISIEAFQGHAAINFSYFITGVTIFLPALLLLWKTNFRGWTTIVLATLFFIVSLVFRKYDAHYELLPMGTHWLWHVFCAVGAFFLAEFLYLVNQLALNRRVEMA